MADETVLSPDIGFIRSLKKAGGDTLKKCYQCATCSVVCPISPDDKPFPRKEMVMAQWGLKEDLAKSPDIWLCHNCNDCTKYCPRGAKPGDVLSALRKQAIQENAVPNFMGKIVGETKYLWVALLIPIILFLIALKIKTGNFFSMPEGEVVFSQLFPVELIDFIFIPITVLVALSFAISVKNFWKTMSGGNPKSMGTGKLFQSLLSTVKEILLHSKFSKCEANKDRAWAHRLVFYGFIGLFITTNWAVFNLYILQWESPYPLNDPEAIALFGSAGVAELYRGVFKLVGNLSALALLIGGILVVTNRLKEKGFASVTSSLDWVFAGMVLAVCITGILSEVLRLANVASIAYPMYFAHLVFVFYIVAYLPFSKLAHLVYRTVAITYAKMAQRDVEV